MDKTNRISAEWIDILTDSQDYASGTLQLIENVIKHVPGNEGIFCFRLHKCSADNEESANAKLITRYSIIDDKSEGFYIEILVSDYNEEFDIPGKFTDNIRKDLNRPENQREYYVSKVLLESVNNFKLKDLFDYHNNINTEQTWKDFYSQSQNLIAHYGLLVFEHLVKFANGEFHVFSSNDFTVNEGQYYQGKENAVKGTLLHIPGTQYEILLPIGVSRTPLETGLVQEVDSSFTASTSRIVPIKEHNYNLLLNDSFENSLMNSNRTLKPRWKSDAANRISEAIINAVNSELDKNSPEGTLFTFNVGKITDMTASEVFVKAFIQLVFSDQISVAKNFAFSNANEVFLTTFIRFFSILYMKSGQSRQMDGRLIYLCSSDLSDEVYFSGSSINNSLAITKRAVFDETGKVTHGLQILRREAEKADEPEQDNKYSYQSIQKIIRPFFKRRALKVLKSDIQQEEFGCCMHDTHMRIGSKIHIDGNYYEASLLFGFSGYVSHFAENVSENIVKILNNTAAANYKKLVIIGYETYSESLAIRIKENLKIKYNRYSEIDYVIYNESLPDTKFYRWNIVKPNESTKFIVVVPVGCTLTTHDKIVADLLRTNFSEDDYNKPVLDSIIAHYVLVLVRDKSENRQENDKLSENEKLFWEDVTEDTKQDTGLVIEYRRDMSEIGADNKIFCYLDVESNWYLPNKCRCCFPKQTNLISEKPLVLSNRSSVVPMTKIGINNGLDGADEAAITQVMKKTPITRDIENMMPLYDALCYGHIVRDGDNHFEYYFQTDKLMESLMKSNNKILNSKLNSWSEKYAKPQSNEIIYFDYVVAPIHSTNANFVNCVSRCLNSKQIIWIDTKKDFRDNIIAKYSSLNSLYHNCRSQGYNVEIRFYYVDDTINSGDSFFRARSLISSIFTKLDNAESSVKVNVFHSVFLLLNRCSFNTQKNYVNDPQKCFHSVFDLNISYMRSYKDACVPCKNELNLSKTIPMCSSTSDIAVMSLRKSRRYIKREAEKINSASQMIPFYSLEKEDENSDNVDKLRLRCYYRMVTSHRVNTVLDNLKGAKNDKKTVEKYFRLQIEEICKLKDESQKLDLLISFLKVISRPFLSFRKSVNEAALKVIITISEYVLLKNVSHAAEYVNMIEYFEPFLKRSENKILLVKVLFSCLTNLKSTFLLRSCTVKEVLELCNDLNDRDRANEFIKSYVFNVKLLLCLSEKNSLSF